MATKKKASKPSTKVSHWHAHHTVSHHLKKRPIFTSSVILVMLMLLAIIWLTLYVYFNYGYGIDTSVSSPYLNISGK